MGCCPSVPTKSDAAAEHGLTAKEGRRGKRLRKPVWKSDAPLTEPKILAMREEFWDTQPHYGGAKVIWDALKAAAEADLPTAQLICDSAGIIIASSDMTTCYDERGYKYEVPKYVLSYPTNLIGKGRELEMQPPR